MDAAVVDGNGTEAGHIIVTTIGGRNGQPKQVCIIVTTIAVGRPWWTIDSPVWCVQWGHIWLLTPVAALIIDFVNFYMIITINAWSHFLRD